MLSPLRRQTPSPSLSHSTSPSFYVWVSFLWLCVCVSALAFVAILCLCVCRVEANFDELEKSYDFPPSLSFSPSLPAFPSSSLCLCWGLRLYNFHFSFHKWQLLELPLVASSEVDYDSDSPSASVPSASLLVSRIMLQATVITPYLLKVYCNVLANVLPN